MQSLTSNKIEIELFGKKLLLSERKAINVNSLNAKAGELDGLKFSLIVIRDGLRINLVPFENNPPKFYEFKRKRELRKLNSIISLEKLIELTFKQIEELMYKVYELEGLDIDSLKKKVELKVLEATEREGLAVTLQTH